MPPTTKPRADSGADEFSGFYTAHFGRIATQLHAYLGDRWEAQDLTQEAFCRAYDRWDRIGAYERPESWVRQVAWNLATNRLRHLRVAVRHLARQREEQVDGPSPDRVALVRELAKLPPKQRLAIVLHHIGGVSTSEIARQEGVAEGTVRSWLTRGRAAMAAQLIEPPASWDGAPEIDETFSLVRRRRARRRAGLTAVVAVLVALPIAIILRSNGSEPPFIGPTGPPVSPSPVSPAPAAVTACVVKALPGISNDSPPTLMSGEPSGRYLVGVSYLPGGGYAPVLWTDGVPSTFDLPGGGLTGIAVNRRGLVAVSTLLEDGSGFKLWTYHEGRLEAVLESPEPGKARQVVRVNERGDILLSGSDTRPPAIRLAGSGPALRELPLPAGAGSVTVKDLGEDGTVVGYADDEAFAVVWAQDLSARRLSAHTEGWRTQASRIRGEWVVGSAKSGSIPLRWNLRTGEVSRPDGLDSAIDVTAHGWVLGTVGGKAVIDMGGQRLQLPGTFSAENPAATTISDDGRLIGGNTSAMRGTEQNAIGWTCS